MATIALDYDRVLHNIDSPLPGRKMGAPIDGALEATRIPSSAHKLIVCTARNLEPGHNHVQKWLEYYGFGDMPVTNRKPVADCYLDDRAVHFSSWESALINISLLLRGE